MPLFLHAAVPYAKTLPPGACLSSYIEPLLLNMHPGLFMPRIYPFLL